MTGQDGVGPKWGVGKADMQGGGVGWGAEVMWAGDQGDVGWRTRGMGFRGSLSIL